jgi:hypothetical protein
VTATRVGIALLLTCGLAALARAESAAFDPGVARRISPQEVQKRREAGEKPIILDTRGAPSDAIITGAVGVPNDKVEEWAKSAAKDAFIVAYCT